MIRDAFPSLSKTRQATQTFPATASYPPDSLWEMILLLFFLFLCQVAPHTHHQPRDMKPTHDKNKPEFIRSFRFRLLSMQCLRRGFQAGNFHRNVVKVLQGTNFCFMTRTTMKALREFSRRFPQGDFSSPLELEHQRPAYHSLQPQLFSRVPRRVRKIRFV